MRAHRLPLWALESHDPVRDFDLVAFTLGYEMCYSNVLNMLELSGLPLLAKDRKGNLKASRVLQLREIARKSGYPELIEATDIIQSAYRPVDSCQFISVSYKDEKGVKRALPLSLAAME